MKRIGFLVWSIALAAGLVGLYQRLVYGHAIAGYTSYVPWGLWVALYEYLVGLSVGAFLISALVYVFGLEGLQPAGRLSLLTALVTLLTALLTVWLDLGHPERFWKILTRTNFASVMGWVGWLYAVYLLVLVGQVWYALQAERPGPVPVRGLPGVLVRLLTRRDLSPEDVRRSAFRLRLLGVAGVPLAVALGGAGGALFAVVEARPYWNSALEPVVSLVSALASGGALLTFVMACLGPRDLPVREGVVRRVGRLTLGFLALYLLCRAFEVLVALYSSDPAHSEPVRWVLAGPQWWVFWGGAVLLGVALPIALMGRPDASPARLGAGALMIAISFLAVRFSYVVPGLLFPQLAGLQSAYVDARLRFSYAPTGPEWLVAVFVLAVGVGLFYLGYVSFAPIEKAREEA